MSYFQLIESGVDVAPLIADLAANPDLWNAIPKRTFEGSPHSEVSDIWVRYNSYDRLIKSPETFNNEHIPVWYEAWKRLPSLKPLILELMTKVEGEILGGVLITKVPAGKKVLPHLDLGWHVEYYDKFYIQLSGAEGCEFCTETDTGEVESIVPMPGEVYLFDNRKKHWVNNDSSIDRMTLIVCIRTEKFGRK